MEQPEQASRFDLFKAQAVANLAIDTEGPYGNRSNAHQDALMGNGSFEYATQCQQLEKLSMNINSRMLIYLFGEQLGDHLAAKWHNECGRDLLRFFRQLHSEYRFFILYELKTNPMLFAHN